MSGEEVALLDPDRLPRLVDTLPAPGSQRPSVVLFVGRQQKNLAVQRIFPNNNPRRITGDGVAFIQADNSTLHSDFPIFFAESYPSSVPISATETVSCHETRRHSLPWAEGLSTSELYNRLHSHLLYPFIDVFCIFADDFPDLQSVVNLLAAWTKEHELPDTLGPVRPKVLIVESGNKAFPSTPYDLYTHKSPRSNVPEETLHKVFPSILVQTLMNRHVSPLVRYGQVKNVLLKCVDEMRQVRERSGHLFSAKHLGNLFRAAISITATGLNRPFDAILASRRNDWTRSSCDKHLSSFYRLGAAANVPCEEMHTYVASTILFDAYPSGMHRRFPLRLIFLG